MKLSCTSVMLPRWTLDETFERLAEYGYDAVELRCRDTSDDIPQIIADLNHVGYQGAMSLEEFGPGEDADKVREDGAYLRLLLGRE